MQTLSKADVNAILAASQIFGSLDEAGRNAVAAELRPVSFAAGQAVFSRGDEGRALFIVLEGRVRLSVLTAEGRELSFTNACAGAIFGEIAMLDGKARTADATAVEKTRALSLDRAALKRLMATSPELVQSVMDFICHRLRAADMQLEGVALHSIEVRLARFLTGLAQQIQPHVINGTVEFELGMSQGELALLLGASRPKVNGAMRVLAEQGIVERQGVKLRCEMDQLRAIAELE